jgi:hypothetical protein
VDHATPSRSRTQIFLDDEISRSHVSVDGRFGFTNKRAPARAFDEERGQENIMGRALHNALHRPMRRKGFWRAASWRRCAANALQAVRIGFEMVLNL